jgi:heat shock protein HslJ
MFYLRTQRTATGSGGCNRLFGAARISGSNPRLSGIATTRKAFPPTVLHQDRARGDAYVSLH